MNGGISVKSDFPIWWCTSNSVSLPVVVSNSPYEIKQANTTVTMATRQVILCNQLLSALNAH